MNVPFQAIHFSVYEGAKKVLLEPLLWKGGAKLSIADDHATESSLTPGGAVASNSSNSSSSGSVTALEEELLDDSLATQLVAGGLAGGVAAAITTPFDVVKTRLQTQGVSSATQYGSTAVVRRQGGGGRAREGPAGGKEGEEEGGEPAGLYVDWYVVIAGGRRRAAHTHAVARPKASPADPPLPYPFPCQLPIMRRIIADEGMHALWRGLKPRVLFNVPAAAVCWGTYESLKTLLADC